MEHSGKSTPRGQPSQPQAHYHHHPTPGQPQPPPPHGMYPPSSQEEEKAESRVVVVTQPLSADPSAAPYPMEEKHCTVSIVAIILSSVAIFCCLWYYVSLFCLLPSFVLAVVSLGTQKYQKNMAYVSIGCSIATFVIMGCLMVVIIISTATPIGVAQANLRTQYELQQHLYAQRYG